MNPLPISCRMQDPLGEKRGNNRFRMSKVDSCPVANSLHGPNLLHSNNLKNKPLVQLLPTRSARVVRVTGT